VLKGTIGFSGNLFAISSDNCSTDSCCSVEITELSNTSHTDHTDDEKGCCGDACDCLCCGHIFTFQEAELNFGSENLLVVNEDVRYVNNYINLFGDTPFQPPRRI